MNLEFINKLNFEFDNLSGFTSISFGNQCGGSDCDCWTGNNCNCDCNCDCSSDD